MPRKDKKKKGKGKKNLSTTDILKLLKKLKPQTQQVVRVNVGDSDKKKKKGDVQSSYNPPFVFPQQGFPAITTLGQPPFRPPLIEESKQAATWSTQPAKEQQKLMPPPESRPPSSSLYITDVESEIELVPRSKRKTKKAEATPEYKVRQPYGSSEPKFNPGITFNEPRLYQSSNLSATSADPARFYQPVQNDKYQADIITTDSAGDQIGTLSNKVSSSEWTGSPEGDITLSVEEKQAAEEEEVAAEDVFIEEPTYEELQQEQIEKEQEEPATPSPVKSGRPPASLKMIDEINSAIKNNFPITNIPSQYLGSRGSTKGLIKTSTPGYVLSPIYEEMLQFTGKK